MPSHQTLIRLIAVALFALLGACDKSGLHDLGRESTEFLVLDAQDFGRGYVARVALPQRVPFGFHGNWVSDRAVSPG